MALSRRSVAAAMASAALVAAGCGGEDEGSSGADGAGAGAEPAAEQVTIKIASYKYLPETVRVHTGGTITWENEDDATHDAETGGEGGGGAFDTQALKLGDAKRVTFDEPGTYAYFCSYHRFMEGTVEVVPDGR